MAKRRFGRLYIRSPSGEPIPVIDVIAWARWFEGDDRRVALTEIGPYKVSTVFLGLDHNFIPDGPPILWETMVFGPGGDDIYSDGYSSEEAALAGHQQACQCVRDRIENVVVPMRLKA